MVHAVSEGWRSLSKHVCHTCLIAASHAHHNVPRIVCAGHMHARPSIAMPAPGCARQGLLANAMALDGSTAMALDGSTAKARAAGTAARRRHPLTTKALAAPSPGLLLFVVKPNDQPFGKGETGFGSPNVIISPGSARRLDHHTAP